MSEEVFQELTELDKLVHEPARLALLTALAACRKADFMYLRRLTGLTQGNLSSHLVTLEGGGLVRIEKRFVERRPNTTVALTGAGRRAVERHWEQLADLRKRASSWEAAPPSPQLQEE